MSVSPHQARRYARQMLLAEIGVEGQARLCATACSPSAGADSRAAQTASDYLARAGLVVDRGTGVPVRLPGPSQVAAIAGNPVLGEAATALLGALAAVETVKQVLGVGRAASCTVPALSGGPQPSGQPTASDRRR